MHSLNFKELRSFFYKNPLFYFATILSVLSGLYLPVSVKLFSRFIEDASTSNIGTSVIYTDLMLLFVLYFFYYLANFLNRLVQINFLHKLEVQWGNTISTIIKNLSGNLLEETDIHQVNQRILLYYKSFLYQQVGWIFALITFIPSALGLLKIVFEIDIKLVFIIILFITLYAVLLSKAKG